MSTVDHVGVGIHKISAAAYHADPCETPSLSSSIVNILASKSPAHAKIAHPRLTEAPEREEAEHFDIGTAVHALLLEGEDVVQVVEAKDWRTNAAKDAREQARLAGKVPLLAEVWERVKEMAAATRAQLDAAQAYPPLFVDGTPERTLVWDEYGVTCRALVDWLHDDHSAIDDFKTTSRSADPDTWSKGMFSFGGDVQAAFYMRGVQLLTGSFPEFRFVVQETFPPYALAVFSPAPSVLELANYKIDRAIEQWSDCLESGHWPAYPRRVCHVELPPWMEARVLEREAMRRAA